MHGGSHRLRSVATAVQLASQTSAGQRIDGLRHQYPLDRCRPPKVKAKPDGSGRYDTTRG